MTTPPARWRRRCPRTSWSPSWRSRGRIGREGARLHPFIAFDPLREVVHRAIGQARPASSRQRRRPPRGAGKMPPRRRTRRPARWRSCATPSFTPGSSGEGISAGRLSAPWATPVSMPAPTPMPRRRCAGPRSGAGSRAARALRPLRGGGDPDHRPREPVQPVRARLRRAGGAGALGAGAARVPEPASELRRHFGHETGTDGADGVEARDAWMRQAAELIDRMRTSTPISRTPLVYDADYAARFGAHLPSLCARFKRLPSRLMYGSDWWLNRFEPGADGAVAAFQRRLGDWLGPGGRDAVMGRNALRFLGLARRGRPPGASEPQPPAPARLLRRRAATALAGVAVRVQTLVAADTLGADGDVVVPGARGWRSRRRRRRAPAYFSNPKRRAS